jgi:hypothetical protein
MIKSPRIYIRCCKCLHIGQFRDCKICVALTAQSLAPGPWLWFGMRMTKASIIRSWRAARSNVTPKHLMEMDGTWMEYRKSIGNDGVVDNIAYTLYVYIYIICLYYFLLCIYIYMYTATIPTSVGKWMENGWKHMEMLHPLLFPVSSESP